MDFAWAPPDNPRLDQRANLYRNAVDIRERRIIPNGGRRDTTELESSGFSPQNTARFSLLADERHALTFGVDGYRDTQRGNRNGAPRPQFPRAEQDVLGVFL